jgi:hypothetical protein
VGYEGQFVGSEFATDFSKEIEKYLKKEASYAAIIGPFFKNPFCCDFKISSLNTVIKHDSVERRVILDLSYPVGNSINDGISQEYYLGMKTTAEVTRWQICEQDRKPIGSTLSTKIASSH